MAVKRSITFDVPHPSERVWPELLRLASEKPWQVKQTTDDRIFARYRGMLQRGNEMTIAIVSSSTNASVVAIERTIDATGLVGPMGLNTALDAELELLSRTVLSRLKSTAGSPRDAASSAAPEGSSQVGVGDSAREVGLSAFSPETRMAIERTVRGWRRAFVVAGSVLLSILLFSVFGAMWEYPSHDLRSTALYWTASSLPVIVALIWSGATRLGVVVMLVAVLGGSYRGYYW